MAESSAAEENIELANLSNEDGEPRAAADREEISSAVEEKSDGDNATGAPEIEPVEDIENGEAPADSVDPVSPDPPKEEAPKRSSPKKAKKGSKESKLRVFLLDGRTLDLDGGVCSFI